MGWGCWVCDSLQVVRITLEKWEHGRKGSGLRSAVSLCLEEPGEVY